MILKSKNINLRAPEPSDIELLYNWENDTDIWRISNTIVPYSQFAIEQYVLSSTQDIYTSRQLRLMIDLIKENISIGVIDLFDYDPLNRRSGVGILILKKYRNMGYASESLAIVEKYTKEILNFHQLWCNISEHNIASIKLFERANYINTGIKKDWMLVNDKWINELFFQKLL